MMEKRKDSNILMLGIIAVIAIVILVFLFKQAIAGSYAYTEDKIIVVPQLYTPPTPGIQPDAPTTDDRFQQRYLDWTESNRAYVIPGKPITTQKVEGPYYPAVYEQPAWVEYTIVEKK